MLDSEIEVMISLNFPITQRRRDYDHVLMMRFRDVI